jgi:hypothetical protein
MIVCFFMFFLFIEFLFLSPFTNAPFIYVFCLWGCAVALFPYQIFLFSVIRYFKPVLKYVLLSIKLMLLPCNLYFSNNGALPLHPFINFFFHTLFVAIIKLQLINYLHVLFIPQDSVVRPKNPT